VPFHASRASPPDAVARSIDASISGDAERDGATDSPWTARSAAVSAGASARSFGVE